MTLFGEVCTVSLSKRELRPEPGSRDANSTKSQGAGVPIFGSPVKGRFIDKVEGRSAEDSISAAVREPLAKKSGDSQLTAVSVTATHR